jgi:hypothetical protein
MTPIGLFRVRAALAGGVLLLPWLAAADSQPQGGVGAKALRANAHLDFRIIIPRMLALQVDGAHVAPAAIKVSAAANSAAGPPQTVAVYGNGRTTALGATAADDSQGGLILSAAARKAIAEDAVCAPAPVQGTVRGIVCTASSP